METEKTTIKEILMAGQEWAESDKEKRRAIIMMSVDEDCSASVAICGKEGRLAELLTTSIDTAGELHTIHKHVLLTMMNKMADDIKEDIENVTTTPKNNDYGLYNHQTV